MAKAEGTAKTMTELELRAAFAQKKNKVMKAVKGVVKTGTAPTAMGGYTYAEEREIVKQIRKVLIDNSLSPGVSATGFIGDPIGRTVGKNNVTWYVYNIKFEITLTDCTTGYFETYHWIGQGDDPSDKAINKACTGALKYFLLKNFLLPTGDDAEAFETPGGAPPPENSGKSKPDFPKPGEPFKKRETQQQSTPPKEQPNKDCKLPAYSHKNTEEIMGALMDFFRQQDTGNYKFNEEKFKAEVWQRYGQWPTTAVGAKKIRSEIMHLDVSDEI